MRFQQSPELLPARFEGASVEEAVQRARDALGPDAPIRCWRTRRGGVFGFFEREVYVAGVEEPDAGRAVAGPSPERRPPRETTGATNAPATGVPARLSAPRPSDGVLGGPLEDLVASTHDEVTLDFAGAPFVFRDVLAEAEAALGRSREPSQARLGEDEASTRVDGGVAERADGSEHEWFGSLLPGESDQGAVPLSSGPDAPLGSRRSRVSALGRDLATEPDETSLDVTPLLAPLVEGLRAIGVPESLWSDHGDVSLDGLARSLCRLPEPRALPAGPGSVIAVVGARRDARAAAEQLSAQLQLDPDDVVALDEDARSLSSRLGPRGSSPRATIVTLVAPVGARTLDAAAATLSWLAPDYVLGAVPVTLKRADVRLWSRRLGGVDALALSRWAESAAPAELLGAMPVASVDGVVMTTLRWVSLLVTAVLEQR